MLWWVLSGLLAAILAGCQALPRPADQALGPRLDASMRILAAPGSTVQERTQAGAQYRELVASHLPELLEEAAQANLVPAGKDLPGVAAPDTFAAVTPVVNPRATEPGLHRDGLGLPVIGRIYPGGANAPLAGFQVPLTLLALPKDPPTRCCDAALVDAQQVRSVRTVHGDFTVAMDLEAPLDATRATGPGLGAGLLKLLRPGRFAGRPRVIFLQPFDPAKTPVVLVHGLMSTPRMWAPLVKALLADERIRDRFQFWFFYYPTGQPVPLSALQLREALDQVVTRYRPVKPMILVGHSMGGILSRAQVSRITLKDAETVSPGIASWPEDSTARRALVFEPRQDLSRVVFMFTPHRGSRLATSGIGAWGIRLIRLPDWLAGELAHYGHQLADVSSGRLPTSIHSLSPNSTFLRVLDQSRPSVPTHSVIGDRGRGDRFASSDGVVPFTSSHLGSAESEVMVPTGHSGIAHPLAIEELRRILLLPDPDTRKEPSVETGGQSSESDPEQQKGRDDGPRGGEPIEPQRGARPGVQAQIVQAVQHAMTAMEQEERDDREHGELAERVRGEGQHGGVAHGVPWQQETQRHRDAGDEDEHRPDQRGQDPAGAEQGPEHRFVGAFHQVTHKSSTTIDTDRPALAINPPLVISRGSNGSRGAVFGMTWNQVTL